MADKQQYILHWPIVSPGIALMHHHLYPDVSGEEVSWHCLNVILVPRPPLEKQRIKDLTNLHYKILWLFFFPYFFPSFLFIFFFLFPFLPLFLLFSWCRNPFPRPNSSWGDWKSSHWDMAEASLLLSTCSLSKRLPKQQRHYQLHSHPRAKWNPSAQCLASGAAVPYEPSSAIWGFMSLEGKTLPVSTGCSTAHLCGTHLLLLMKELISSWGFQGETGVSADLCVPAVLPLPLQTHSLYLRVPGGCRTD